MITHPFPIPDKSPFPVTNLPFGIFSTGANPKPRPGLALGDFILDLQALLYHGLQVNIVVKAAILSSTLEGFAVLPVHLRQEFRGKIQQLVSDAASLLYSKSDSIDVPVCISRLEASMHLPMKIGQFTDFMCSLEHVESAGKFIGREVPENFFNIPLAYNGRASSVIISGQPICRPSGILPSDPTKYSACQKLDYETELGIFVSKPIPYGGSVSASAARDHIFGIVLLNDWSARDIQFFEMTPLGPFNGKATATSISPWVITLDALEEAGALVSPQNNGLVGGKNTANSFLQCHDDLSIRVSTYISRDNDQTRELLGTSDLKHLHWSPFQMLAHHSSSGCGLSTGDLIGTGTLSSTIPQATEFGEGFEEGKRSGCLHELVQGGTKPLLLKDGSQLSWLEDGDTVIMEGWAGKSGSSIGFGELFTLIRAAKPLDL